MNRRGFFTRTTAILGAFLFGKKKARAGKTVEVSLFFQGNIGLICCPFCGYGIAAIGEAGLYPVSMYCRKCKKGFDNQGKVELDCLGLEKPKMRILYNYE